MFNILRDFAEKPIRTFLTLGVYPRDWIIAAGDLIGLNFRGLGNVVFVGVEICVFAAIVGAVCLISYLIRKLIGALRGRKK